MFYVANSEIILEYPILGTNFLQQNKVILNYQNPDNCTITAQVISNDHQPSIEPLLVSDKKSEIEYKNLKAINNVGLTNYIFQSKFIHYGQIKGTFKSNTQFQVPTQSFDVIDYPLVQFEKINGRISPWLQVEDCVELKLFSKECVSPDDLEVGHQKIRGNLPTDGHLGASSNFLDPEIRNVF